MCKKRAPFPAHQTLPQSRGLLSYSASPEPSQGLLTLFSEEMLFLRMERPRQGAIFAITWKDSAWEWSQRRGKQNQGMEFWRHHSISGSSYAWSQWIVLDNWNDKLPFWSLSQFVGYYVTANKIPCNRIGSFPFTWLTQRSVSFFVVFFCFRGQFLFLIWTTRCGKDQQDAYDKNVSTKPK